MNLCIVWEREDGGVSITYPVPQARADGETDEQFAERIRIKDVPAGRPFHVQRKDTLPTSRRLRNAWKKGSGIITLDLPTARKLIVEEIRAERDRRLAESDKEKFRLDDVGSPQEQAKLKAKRQSLRDLPAKVETEIATLTDVQLEAYTPTWPT